MRIALSGLLLHAALGDFAPPRVSVDLDRPPEHRWDEVVAGSREAFRQASEAILNSPKIKRFLPAARWLVGNALEARRLLPGEHYLEAQGIARGLGLPVVDIVLLTAFYDLAAAADSPVATTACTGIVAQSASGEIFHGRNLDYFFVEPLSNLTLIVDFKKNGSTLFTAVTFGPTPGFNTVVRHGAFSVTQDERDKGSVLENFWDALVLGRPALFSRMRQAAETLATYSEALDFLTKVKMDADAYFILGGTKAGEGAVVTRDRDAATDVWRLDATAGRWYLLETNYDHDTPPPSGDDRRHPLQRAMEAVGQTGITAAAMWDVISTTSVNTSAGERRPLNNDTIYSTVMQASRPESFKTLVRSHIARPNDALLVI